MIDRHDSETNLDVNCQSPYSEARQRYYEALAAYDTAIAEMEAACEQCFSLIDPFLEALRFELETRRSSQGGQHD